MFYVFCSKIHVSIITMSSKKNRQKKDDLACMRRDESLVRKRKIETRLSERIGEVLQDTR